MGVAYLNYKCCAFKEDYNDSLLLLPLLWEVLKQKYAWYVGISYFIYGKMSH